MNEVYQHLERVKVIYFGIKVLPTSRTSGSISRHYHDTARERGGRACECQGRGPKTVCLTFSDVFLFQLLNRLPFNYSHKRGDNTILPTAINRRRRADGGGAREQVRFKTHTCV